MSVWSTPSRRKRDRDRPLAVVSQEAADPSRRAGDRNRFAVERDDLVAGHDPGRRGRRALYNRDDRRPDPGQVQRLGGKRPVLAGQALRRDRQQADLRRDPVLAVGAIGGADAEGDRVEPVQLRVIIPQLRDFLPAPLGGDVVGRERGNVRAGPGTGRAQPHARNQNQPATPTHRNPPERQDCASDTTGSSLSCRRYDNAGRAAIKGGRAGPPRPSATCNRDFGGSTP